MEGRNVLHHVKGEELSGRGKFWGAMCPADYVQRKCPDPSETKPSEIPNVLQHGSLYRVSAARATHVYAVRAFRLTRQFDDGLEWHQPKAFKSIINDDE